MFISQFDKILFALMRSPEKRKFTKDDLIDMDDYDNQTDEYTEVFEKGYQKRLE